MNKNPALVEPGIQRAGTRLQLSGERAESLALTFLLRRGYALVERNYRRRHGEIDLIMRDPDGLSIVFVEVRYRGKRHLVSPLESITMAKQRRIVRTALAWLGTRGLADCPARIDVIGISPMSDYPVSAGPVSDGPVSDKPVSHAENAPEALSAGHTVSSYGQVQIVWVRSAVEA